MSLPLSSRLACAGLLVALALPFTACGKGDGDPVPQGGRRGGGTDRGPYVGQEIWLTYDSLPHAGIGTRVSRSRDAARVLAEDLRGQVLKGDDIAELARKHSNAPGAPADGFSGILPVNPENLDERDRALIGVPVGGVTDLVDWRGGWWFAKRVTLPEAQTLEKLFRALEQAGKEARKWEVRARAILIQYVGAWPFRFTTTDTLEQATEKMKKLVTSIQQGADFDKLARETSQDDSGDRGGVLLATEGPGKGKPWITRFDTGYPAKLLQVLFEAPIGLWPEPVVTARGVVVFEILERRRAP